MENVQPNQYESEGSKVLSIHSVMPKTGKAALLPVLLAGLLLPARAEVERAPIRVGSNIDLGQLFGGEISNQGAGVEDPDQFLSRTGVYMTQSGTINKRLDVTVSVGGLFWYSLPASSGAPHTRLVKFGPGVGQASGLFRLGDPEQPAALLEFGYFAHKYNPDAKNLGEYQLRSGTYPGYLWTGGWSIINSAAYMAQGLKLTVPTLGGMLTHDFLLFQERDFEPTYDLSPSYQVAFKPTAGIEMGAGITWAHGIPVRPSLTTPEERSNAYYNGKPLPQSEWNKPGWEAGDPHIVAAGDPRLSPESLYIDKQPYTTAADNGIPNSQLQYYTFQGFKVMGRAALNPQAWIQTEALGPEDLKIYGEFAILGLKNYPFYYEKMSERMPIMLGINLPTFRLLDMLSIEVEYYKSPFQNNFREVFQNTYPRWKLPPDITPENYQDSLVNKTTLDTEDDLHWSVYAKKTVFEGVDIFVQVASDHMRKLSFNAEPSDMPVTRKPGQWYYLARVQMGF